MFPCNVFVSSNHTAWIDGLVLVCYPSILSQQLSQLTKIYMETHDILSTLNTHGGDFDILFQE